MPESLRFGKNHPTLFSHQEPFVFHLMTQSGEMLRCEAKQLGNLPLLQEDWQLDGLFCSATIQIDHLTEKLLKTLPPGKATPIFDVEHA